MYLAPREPTTLVDGQWVDGMYATNDKYGGVQKVIRTGAKPVQEFAEPRPYFTAQAAAARAPEAGPPPTADELAKLKAKRKNLQLVLDDPATSDQQRLDAMSALIKV